MTFAVMVTWLREITALIATPAIYLDGVAVTSTVKQSQATSAVEVL